MVIARNVAVFVAALSIGGATCGAADDALDVPLGHVSIVHLSASPSQVIIGNPAIADVTVQSARTLTVFGKYPGGTSLTILDGGGNVMMEASVVVVSSATSGVSIHYGTGKNWVPGGASVSAACSVDHCSNATSVPSDGSYKASAPTATATTFATK